MDIDICRDQMQQISAIIKYLQSQITTRLTTRDNVTIALSGGKSPIELFKQLSLQDFPWEQITITLVDDRLVDKANPDSNENLVHSYLLQNKASLCKFIPIVNKAPVDITIDIAILGMGEDGHTASIFPECQELDEALTTEHQYLTTTPVSANYKRMSLSLTGLLNIPNLILSINGDKKLAILKEAESAPNRKYPISYLIAKHNNFKTFWYK